MPLIFQELALFAQAWWLELVCALTVLVLTPIFSAYLVAFENSVAAKAFRSAGQRDSNRTASSLSLEQADPPEISPVAAENPVTAVTASPTPPSPLQPLADLWRALRTPDDLPAGTSGLLPRFYPLVTFALAMLALGAIAFGPQFQIARDLNIGLPFLFIASSLATVAILFRVPSVEDPSASPLPVLRVAAQFAGFQICAAIALLCGLMLAGAFQIHGIVNAQSQLGVWLVFLIPIAFALYFAATLASAIPLSRSRDAEATPRGCRSAVDSISQSAAIFAAAALAATVFLGGWLRPFAGVSAFAWLDWFPAATVASIAGFAAWGAGNRKHLVHAAVLWLAAFVTLGISILLAAVLLYEPLRPMQPAVHGAFWSLAKTMPYVIIFVWFRAVSPRFGFHQHLRAAWDFLLPVAVVQFLGVAVSLILRGQFGWNRWLAFTPAFCVTLAFAAFLLLANDRRWITTTLSPLTGPQTGSAQGAESDAR